MKRRSLTRSALILLPLQLVFRGGEALLPVVLARWFGRSSETDVYYFALAFFALPGSLIFSAYQDSALVPILTEVKLRSRAELPRVTGSLLSHTVLFGTALSSLVGLAAMAWFFVRYEPSVVRLAVAMIPAFSGVLVATSVKTFFAALLNSEHRFGAFPVASAAGMALNITLLALFHERGVIVIPLAALAGELLTCLLLAGAVRWGLELRMTFTLSRPEPVRRFAGLVSSEVGGAAVTRINPLVDQLMAGLTGVVGGGTLLRYSGDVAAVPTSLLQAALLPVLLTHLADAHVSGRIGAIRATTRRASVTVAVLLATASVIVFFLRSPLLELAFGGGQMDARGIAEMAEIVPYHLLGLAPFGVLLVYVRAHVAIQNSRIMLGMGVLNAGLNVVMNAALLPLLGLKGLALSTSGVQLIVAAVFGWRLSRRLNALEAQEANRSSGSPLASEERAPHGRPP